MSLRAVLLCLRVSFDPAFTLDIAICRYKVQVPTSTIHTLCVGCTKHVGDLLRIHVQCVTLSNANFEDETVVVHCDFLVYLSCAR